MKSGARLSMLQLTTSHSPFEQWKASRHRLLRVAVVNRNVGKRDAPVLGIISSLFIKQGQMMFTRQTECGLK